MTSRDDRTRLHVEIPIETKQEMKDADGPMWKLIDEGVRIALGLDEGSTEAAVKQRLEDVRQERSEINDQLHELEDRVEKLERMEDDLEQRLSNIQERKQSHKERLCAILEEMHDDPRNRPVLAWMPQVKDAAMQEYGSESKDNIRRVIEDLRGAALEEEIPISSERLSRTTQGNPKTANSDGLGDEDEFRVLSSDDNE